MSSLKLEHDAYFLLDFDPDIPAIEFGKFGFTFRMKDGSTSEVLMQFARHDGMILEDISPDLLRVTSSNPTAVRGKIPDLKDVASVEAVTAWTAYTHVDDADGYGAENRMIGGCGMLIQDEGTDGEAYIQIDPIMIVNAMITIPVHHVPDAPPLPKREDWGFDGDWASDPARHEWA